ncbi:MAG TPA: DUF4148 domain-containing protein [Ideonella sp.]|uniref:DUF4148 domain-containing protein n=1 Tax=Ideonella sp. TaxID=1929293 RepID=UPI002C3CDF0B|nr:DUF4148 domain-containing protein [Ideonella sp.]HSI51632.1 DUF4148 domain-containing protein [Ideonella sp.]
MSTFKFALSAIAFTLASGAAMAQEAVPAQWNSAYTPDVSASHSGKTRAEVVAELVAARQNGELSRYDNDSYSPVQLPGTRIAAKQTMPAGTGHALSRAEVRAEFLAARRSGELNPFDAEPYVNVSTRVMPVSAQTTVAAR